MNELPVVMVKQIGCNWACTLLYCVYARKHNEDYNSQSREMFISAGDEELHTSPTHSANTLQS